VEATKQKEEKRKKKYSFSMDDIVFLIYFSRYWLHGCDIAIGHMIAAGYTAQYLQATISIICRR
jgi:hypothetical protein